MLPIGAYDLWNDIKTGEKNLNSKIKVKSQKQKIYSSKIFLIKILLLLH